MTVDEALHIEAHMEQHDTETLRAARARLSSEPWIREYQAEGRLLKEITRRKGRPVWST